MTIISVQLSNYEQPFKHLTEALQINDTTLPDYINSAVPDELQKLKLQPPWMASVPKIFKYLRSALASAERH